MKRKILNTVIITPFVVGLIILSISLLSFKGEHKTLVIKCGNVDLEKWVKFYSNCGYDIKAFVVDEYEIEITGGTMLYTGSANAKHYTIFFYK